MLSPNYHELLLEQVPDHHPVSVFARYWASKKDAVTGLPHRESLKPSEMLSTIPWLLILEKTDDEPGPQFRYRLAGTGCTELFGIDYTNKLLGEHLLPEATKVRQQEFNRALRSREPIFSRTPLPIPDREFISAYRGVFPVTKGGSQANQIFCVIASEQTIA